MASYASNRHTNAGILSHEFHGCLCLCPIEDTSLYFLGRGNVTYWGLDQDWRILWGIEYLAFNVGYVYIFFGKSIDYERDECGS